MRKDIIGKKFGRLTVIRYLRTGKYWKAIWQCRCDCGAVVESFGERLNSGNTKSCGCLVRDATTARSTKHGHAARGAHTNTYYSWRSVIDRCTNPSSHAFHLYGGKGIGVCKRWLKFENFLADMGEKPHGTSIDRIRNDIGYSKANCRWATKKIQAVNRRTTRFITFQGETLCIKDWAERSGVKYTTLLQRLKYKWPLEKALS